MDRKRVAQEIEAIESELRRRKELEGLTEYRPRSFHWDFFARPEQTRLFVGSNQSGKTSIAGLIAVGYALGQHLWIQNFAKWVEKNPLDWVTKEEVLSHEFPKCNPPAKIAVVAIDFKSAVTEKILEIIPQPHRDGKYIKRVEKAQNNIHKIIFQNGSIIQFFSSVQDTMHFEGGTWDLILFDEPPRQEHYVAMRRGALVKKAPMLFSMTPLNQPWIFDTLMSDANKEDSGVFMATCNLFDPQIDWMDDDDKNDFKKQTERENPHAVRARIYGEFTHLLGRIYPSYDSSIHRLPVQKCKPESGYTYGMTIDPHDRKPFMISWWYVNPLGHVVFFNEWPKQMFHEMRSSDWTVTNYITMIKEYEESLPAPVTYRYIDPNSGPKRNALTGQSFVDAFSLEGLHFDHQVDDRIAYGHGIVRDYLWHDPDEEISNTNCPRVYFSEDCENICYAIDRYTWDEKRAEKGLSEKPQERHKDPMDVVRYTLVKNPQWIPPGDGDVWTPPVAPRSSF